MDYTDYVLRLANEMGVKAFNLATYNDAPMRCICDEITDYTYKAVLVNKQYDKESDTLIESYNMVTTIEFANGDTVSVSCPEKKADPYTGFYTAIAKYAMGGDNTVNDMADYWIEKHPKIMTKRIREEMEYAALEAAEEERANAKLRKLALKREARRRKFAYEAAQLANEKYGVPLEFEVNNNV